MIPLYVESSKKNDVDDKNELLRVAIHPNSKHG
jgi:hypothetical protein